MKDIDHIRSCFGGKRPPNCTGNDCFCPRNAHLAHNITTTSGVFYPKCRLDSMSNVPRWRVTTKKVSFQRQYQWELLLFLASWDWQLVLVLSLVHYYLLFLFGSAKFKPLECSFAHETDVSFMWVVIVASISSWSGPKVKLSARLPHQKRSLLASQIRV